jgi:hypothetical protein
MPHHLARCATLAVVAPGGGVFGHPSPHVSAGQQPPRGPDAGMGDAMQSMENPVSKQGRYQWSYDTCRSVTPKEPVSDLNFRDVQDR